MTEHQMEEGAGVRDLAYQDDESTEVPVQAKECNVQTRLRRDRERVLVDAAVVERIKKTRKEVVDVHESGDEDETMLQYHSGDEDERVGHRNHGFDLDDE